MIAKKLGEALSGRWGRALCLGAAAVGASSGGVARAQALPNPYQMVSQMDFQCHPAYGPPPVDQLTVRQLNPVIVDKIPAQLAKLGPLEQVCVPVSKNGQTPGPAVLPFQRWFDVACYQATAPDIDVDLTLSHLNPVLATLPDEHVRMKKLAQVCVPVRKNNSQIPDAVRQLVAYGDFGCYDLAEPTAPANRQLVLSHLNPVIREMGFDDRKVDMKRARQLCVPIAKNNEVLPPPVQQIQRWADFLKYDITVVQGAVPSFPLTLTHLNPLFSGVPPFYTVLQYQPLQLMVPVAKNYQIPPGAPGGGI